MTLDVLARDDSVESPPRLSDRGPAESGKRARKLRFVPREWILISLLLGLFLGLVLVVEALGGILVLYGTIVGAVQYGYLRRRIPMTSSMWIVNSAVGWALGLGLAWALFFATILGPVVVPFSGEMSFGAAVAALSGVSFGFLQTRFRSSTVRLPFWWLTCGVSAALIAPMALLMNQMDTPFARELTSWIGGGGWLEDPILTVIKGIVGGLIYGLVTAVHLWLVANRTSAPQSPTSAED